MIARELFKEIMAAAPGPAAVVTAFDDRGRPNGLTLSAVCSVSMEPPLVLVCLDRGSNTLAAILESRSFTINYLADGRDALAMHFATKSAHKFEDLPWARPMSDVGGPVLTDDAAAYAACELSETVEGGDHVVVIGAVVDGSVATEHHALAYARRKFFSGRYLDAAV